MFDDVVTLNVGGACFLTRRPTLSATPYFADLARTHPNAPQLFVDRDPTHFRHVLNWLRGLRHLPEDVPALSELLYEADAYAFTEMSLAIQAALRAAVPGIPTSLADVAQELRLRRRECDEW